jgi:ABC-type branched-subunit amino acid transport system substrate-binding protein
MGRARRGRGFRLFSVVAMTTLLMGMVGLVGTAPVAGASGSTLMICVDEELTGAAGAYGADTPTGVEAHVDQINATGGLLGHKLAVKVINNQSEPSLAASVLRECVQKYHAWAVLGIVLSPDLVPTIPVANELHVPFISWLSGWYLPGLPHSAYQSWSFPGAGNIYVADNIDAINDIAVPRHYTRIAVIYENDPSAASVLPAMEKSAKLDHFTLVAHQTMNVGQTNVTPAVLQLLKHKPQMIILAISPGTDSVTFLKAMRAQNPTIPMAVCPGCSEPSFISAMGGPKAMANIYSTGTEQQLADSLAPTKANQPILNDIHQYYSWMNKEGFKSTDDQDQGPSGWSNVEQLVDAAKAEHSVSQTAIKNGLAHLHATTLGLRWSRTPTGYDNVVQLGAVVQINANGSVTTLKSHTGAR